MVDMINRAANSANRRPVGKHFTIRIEGDLWPYIEMLALDEKKKRTDIINRAIRYYIKHMVHTK